MNNFNPEESIQAKKDNIFCLDATAQTRKDKIAADLIGLENALEANPESPASALDYIDKRVAEIEERVGKLEAIKHKVWVLTAQTAGKSARTSRAAAWRYWGKHVTGKLGTIKESCLGCRMKRIDPVALLTPASPAPVWHRGSGHLERVKLPLFSGWSEEYAEFNMQFRELCGGEKYPEIIELTQLRQKVPKEAVQAIAGLTDPTQAWERTRQALWQPRGCDSIYHKETERFQDKPLRAGDQGRKSCPEVFDCSTQHESHRQFLHR